ncbi:SSU ribosomal protein S6P modification protein [Desulfocicer vacuolatum DSM 3385]|uniref:SSU ribosomal protein S6P modification protein n=1 Tax=Desulfocicer vacuolatum DSM 3385 TaxID=1121400 RepID=A0A1W2CYZ3_9BACT|nr:RimK family alpha-L-glutamate ligase [Desulfocicer vacuolatum]SMC90390.1 SSU ribosomal protein S6P modification protein [Desulfocicer vacuolatum DSM 3385]
MNIGIMTVNDYSFHPTMRLAQAAEQQGCKICLINPYKMLSGIGKGKFQYTVNDLVSPLDVVLPRQGSPMGEYGMALLRQLMHLNIPLINGVEGITIARNQYITLQTLAAADLPVPDTFFITAEEGFHRAVTLLGGYPVIAKKMDGMGGEGVFKITGNDDISKLCHTLLKEKKGAVVQRFIPPENRRDLRILVVGNEVIGAMALSPGKGEFRSNFHLNGKAQCVDLSAEWKTMAIKATRACHLEISGVDLIITAEGRPYIMEVNYSPGFRGLEEATHIDIAGKIIEHVCHRINRHKRTNNE